MTTTLTVTHLLERGFSEVDPWLSLDGRLHAPRALPVRRGVYAFAIGDEVQYVGLASRSLKQRLGFYCNPGASQQTNVRLNAIIQARIAGGDVLRVLIAHPEDMVWNGLRVSGSEGLEAALIEDFSPPWNKKGSTKTIPAVAAPASALKPARGEVGAAICDFVRSNPKCTELQIARAVFGPSAVQQRVNSLCRELVQKGLISRLPTSPITYMAVH